MPYPNEHACRINSPDKYDEFRRGTREHEGKQYSVIYGRKKGTDEWEDQAYRYDKTKWSASEAQSHCKSHDGSFEAASEEGESLRFGLPDGIEMPPEFLSRFATTPWAMLPSALQTVWDRGPATRRQPAHLHKVIYTDRCLIVEAGHYVGPSLGAVCSERAMPTAKLDMPRASRTVAVVPVYGVIDKSRIYFADVFADELAALLGDLVANQDIGAIVLDVDSPGGAVYGVPELADQIRYYRAAKPIYSIATGDMASAAYWLGAAATKAFAAPSARVGSIGVWTAHVDASKAFEEAGFKVTLISAGKYKVEGNPFEALGDEAKAARQIEVDAYYGQFIESIAKSRNRRPTTVSSGFGEGRILVAERALEEGLIDGIATLPQLLGAIVPRRKGSRAATARARLAIEEAQ